jgi:hypothetical protein
MPHEKMYRISPFLTYETPLLVCEELLETKFA